MKFCICQFITSKSNTFYFQVKSFPAASPTDSIRELTAKLMFFLYVIMYNKGSAAFSAKKWKSYFYPYSKQICIQGVDQASTEEAVFHSHFS